MTGRCFLMLGEMSARLGPDFTPNKGGTVRMKATWSVAVIFEDAKAQEAAITFCDSLVRRFWADFEFDVSWWAFEGLERPEAAEEATNKSLGADVVVFSVQAQSEVPEHVQQWADAWQERRGKREGALVGLLNAGEITKPEPGIAQGFLRHLAHRAGMDFLTEVPQNLLHRFPETLESCSERAHQVTTILDGILHRPSPTPRIPG